MNTLPPPSTTQIEEWYRAYAVFQTLTSGSNRNHWIRSREFVMSSMGYCVGLANAWRFAYAAYKSGEGALFVPYLILIFTIGIPLLYFETILGQFTSCAPVSAFNFSRISKGVGVSMVLLTWFMSLYSIMFLVYPIKYLFLSTEADLPWNLCNKRSDSDIACVEIKKFTKTNFTKICQNVTSDVICPETSADEFWYHVVLQSHEGKSHHLFSATHLGNVLIDKLIIFAFSWGLVLLCTISGLKAISRVAYVALTFPLCTLFILMVLTACQDGASDGLAYFFVPKASALSDPKVWTEAGTQVLLSFGLCTGGQILLSSYNKFETNIIKEATYIAVWSFVCSMATAIAVFSVLGNIALILNVDVSQISQLIDPGFMLVIFTETLGLLPVPNFLCVCFLFMILLFSLNPQMLFMNVISIALHEEIYRLNDHIKKMRCIICLVNFLIGISFVTNGGIYVLELLHIFVQRISLLGIALAEVVLLATCYGVTKFLSDIHFMLSYRIAPPWAVCWLLICPVILTLLFAASLYDLFTTRIYSSSLEIVGRVVSVVILLPIPCGILYGISKTLIKKKKFVECVRPDSRWGPRDVVIKILYMNWLKAVGRRVERQTGDALEEIASEGNVLDLRTAILAHLRKDILLNKLGDLFHYDQVKRFDAALKTKHPGSKDFKETTV